MHTATQHGKLSIVRVLCQKGADVNARDKTICSPLTYAVMRGYEKVVRYLVRELEVGVTVQGVDIANAPTIAIFDILAFPQGKQSGDTIQKSWLADGVMSNLGLPPVVLGSGDKSLIEQFLKIGCSPDNRVSINSTLSSPVLYACEREWVEIVDLLIEYGVELSPFAFSSHCPLCASIMKNNKVLVEKLLQAGARLSLDHLADSEKWTNNAEIKKLLQWYHA